MNAFKRALTSIKRSLDKTILLGLLVIILASLTAGAILVRDSVNTTETNIRRRIPPFVSIEVDPEWAMQHWQETGISVWELEEQWPRELIPLMTELPYVSDFIYTNRFLGDFDLYSYEPIKDYPPFRMFGRATSGISETKPPFAQHGEMELVEGRFFTDAEVSGGDLTDDTPIPALISRSVAEVNHLNVGSVIPFYQSFHSFLVATPEEEEALASLIFDLEIVGIFDLDYEPFDERPNWANNELSEQYIHLREALNAIYVPTWFNHELIHYSYETLVAVLGEERTLAIRQVGSPGDTSFPVIVLHDSLDLDAFRLAAEPLLPENLIFRDLSLIHYDAISSMETLRWISDIVLIGAVIATILILSLMITLFLRDRRHEIGIYMALGERKSKIISQLLAEVLVVSVLGITIALFIGNVISSQMGQSMLRSELTQPITDEESWRRREEMGSLQLMTGLPPQNIPIEEMLELFDVSIGAEVVVVFYVVGLGTVALSVLLPITYVVKLEPKKVLL